MIQGIKIGLEYFDLNVYGESKRIFSYCEKKFGFGGQGWEEIKEEFDYKCLGKLLESKGVSYEEYTE